MKTLINIVFILSFSLITFGQSNRDKIKTLKIAYITEKLDLNEKEAQQFWPIYNNFEDENSRLRGEVFEARKKLNFDTLTEEDAKQFLKDTRLNDAKRLTLENDFVDRLSKVISAKKIILLHKIEDDFKWKMFDEYKKRKH